MAGRGPFFRARPRAPRPRARPWACPCAPRARARPWAPCRGAAPTAAAAVGRGACAAPWRPLGRRGPSRGLPRARGRGGPGRRGVRARPCGAPWLAEGAAARLDRVGSSRTAGRSRRRLPCARGPSGGRPRAAAAPAPCTAVRVRPSGASVRRAEGAPVAARAPPRACACARGRARGRARRRGRAGARRVDAGACGAAPIGTARRPPRLPGGAPRRGDRRGELKNGARRIENAFFRSRRPPTVLKTR